MSLGIQTSRIRRVAHRPTTIDGLPVLAKKGKVYFFDGSKAANGSGEGWDDAANNMQSLFNKLVGGETILVAGRVAEQLVTPVQVFDVSIIGVGNRPRHADSTPSGGNTYASQWAGGGLTAAQANLRILQQGWLIENILFSMVDSNAAGIEVVRNADAGNSERDGSHLIARGVKFAGAGVGIRCGVAGTFTEIPNHVVVEDCEFLQNTFGIRGAIQGQNWTIRRNIFRDSTNAITAPLGSTYIYENIVNGFTAAASSGGIDLTGGQGLNVISKNILGGTYSNAGGYVRANANDIWFGNFTSVSSGTDLASINVADPA